MVSTQRPKFMVREIFVKTFLVLVVVAGSFLFLPVIASAHGDEKDKKAERVFYCYGRGNCDNLHGKADCEKEGGRCGQELQGVQMIGATGQASVSRRTGHMAGEWILPAPRGLIGNHEVETSMTLLMTVQPESSGCQCS